MLQNGHGQIITKMHVLIKSQKYLLYIEMYIKVIKLHMQNPLYHHH